MTARATIGYYKVKAILAHGDCFYDYTNWPKEWVPSATKVLTLCKEHGPFMQQISVHARGQGCRKCNPKKISVSNLKGAQYYLKKARTVHNDKYDYSLVPEMSGALSVVKILCPEHGEFEQRLEKHSSGNGCPRCGVECTYTGKQKRLDRCRETHDNKYDYSLWPAKVTAKTKVTIICPKHGEFAQQVSNHQQGQGCPTCSRGGYDTTSPGYMYVMRSSCGSYMKIGITKSIKRRTKELRDSTPFDFECIVTKYFNNGRHAYELEKFFIKHGKSAKFRGFNGATEWLLFDELVRDVIHTM